MNRFQWDSSYEVGHARIDHEHQGLLALINEVLGLKNQPERVNALPAILDQLLQYADQHFTAEEALMTEHRVSVRHARGHREAHRGFVAEVRAIRRLPVDPERVQRTGEFLKGWLLGHILSYDKALVRELKLHHASDDSNVNHALLEQHEALMKLGQIIDGLPVPAFALDRAHKVTHWNRACVQLSSVPAHQVVGTDEPWRGFYPQARQVLASVLMSEDTDDTLDRLYPGQHRPSDSIPGAIEVEIHFPHLGHSGRWLHCVAAPLHDETGHLIGAVETLEDVTERRLAREALLDSQARLEGEVASRTQELLRRNQELTQANDNMVRMRQQLVQSEKLASIGQLAAGVAHEINNPIGYVGSNLGSLEKYVTDLFRLSEAFVAQESAISDPSARKALKDLRESIDLTFLQEDVPALLRECQEGISRVRKIVQDLKDFSRMDSGEKFEWADLHQGLDSTLTIVNNEIKYKADVIKRYGTLPQIECLASQLNQVFMNLLVNAAQAIGDKRGTITIQTGADDESVWVEIADTGSGIPADKIGRIFDPFYTTKPVGKGTGLGLSLSYGIVQHHAGHITVHSEPGTGTRFRVTLPIRQTGSGVKQPSGIPAHVAAPLNGAAPA